MQALDAISRNAHGLSKLEANPFVWGDDVGLNGKHHVFPEDESIDLQEETMTTQPLVRGGDGGRWEQAIYAFLAEKSAGQAPCISLF